MSKLYPLDRDLYSGFKVIHCSYNRAHVCLEVYAYGDL